MKKLLAIAVAAAITLPMTAMADTKVYGKGHVSVGKQNSVDGLFVQSHSSRIGLKGSNALDGGLTATHQFEIGYNFIDGSTLSPRNSWVGLKGGFGEARIGRQTTPYSVVDDAAAFTTRNDHGLHTFTRTNNALAYINKFGNVGFAVAAVMAGEVEGGKDSDMISNVLVNYSAGPIYAGLAFQGMPDDAAGNSVDAGTKIALAYKGANYGVGLASEKLPGSGDAVNTIAGKYSFGKAYFAGQFGKNKDAELEQKTIEIGYGLGKGTKTYFEYEILDNAVAGTPATATTPAVAASTVEVKTARVGLVHSF